jgi:UPF0716 family protein affecting phage T7 exclusion
MTNASKGFPLWNGSIAWAASSITIKLCFVEVALFIHITHAIPAWCTGTMALVLDVIGLQFYHQY